MEGFGSEELKRSPFNYGSVQDGMYGADTLEKKLKKQYWKAKQSVIEKLGKSQDEFVVAGDADIDIKLEVRPLEQIEEEPWHPESLLFESW